MNPHIRTRHRVARVGELLLDGPRSIKPPAATDDYGWLECDLRVVHWRAGAAESAAVYVDDSANREDGFLPPVLRHVTWARGDDLRRAVAGDLAWPTAAVTLSYVGDRAAAVDAVTRAVHARLAALPFVPFRLSADRSVPDVPTDDRGRVRVYARNGLQSVAYEAPTSPADGGFTDLLLDGLARLRALVSPFDTRGWRESYPHPLDAAELGGSHWWEYGRAADGAPAV